MFKILRILTGCLAFNFACSQTPNDVSHLVKEWYLLHPKNDTTLFRSDTLRFTADIMMLEVKKQSVFSFRQGGSLVCKFGCHVYPASPSEIYCSYVYGMWEVNGSQNLTLYYTDLNLIRSYRISRFTDSEMLLIAR